MTQLNNRSEDMIRTVVRRAEERMLDVGLNMVEASDVLIVMMGTLLFNHHGNHGQDAGRNGWRSRVKANAVPGVGGAGILGTVIAILDRVLA